MYVTCTLFSSSVYSECIHLFMWVVVEGTKRCSTSRGRSGKMEDEGGSLGIFPFSLTDVQRSIIPSGH